MIIDPYDTTIGAIVANREIKQILNKFLVDTPDKLLGYEYKSENPVKYMFITGKNRVESELPVFKHPILLNDTIKNELYLFLDVRQFVRIDKNTHIINLSDIVKDTSNFNILLIRGVYQELLYHNPNRIRGFMDTLAQALTALIGGILNTALILNPVEMMDLNITLLHYTLSMLGGDIHSIPSKVTRYNMARANSEYVSNILSNLETGDSVEVLTTNIKRCSSSSKLQNVSSDLILNLTRGIFYCDNSVELLAMMFEHPPTVIALLYAGYDDRVYRRTKLTTVLTNNKKRIPLDNFVRIVGNTINDMKI